jgi:UDP-glucose-4-epimerase GalE
MSETVLVTGATGYIGGHVCKLLKNSGYQVIGVDRVRREHTLKHMDQFLEADYSSPECFTTLLEHDSIVAVVHCAGTSLVGPSVADPAEYYVNNVAKTAMLLSVLKTLPRPPVVVFSSSAAVYGAPDVDVIYEEQSWNPISPYGQSKAMIEIMLTDVCCAYGMTAMSLRYFNACGADLDGELGQAPGATHIVARLLESVRDSKEFTLYGTDYPTPDGTCVRDYVHVEDLAQAHMMAIQYCLSFNGANNGIHYMLNLGTGKGYSNREILHAVEKYIGKVNVAYGERRHGDPAQLVAGRFLATATLGWSPAHSDLETIINSAWKWYNNPPESIDNESK